MQDYTLYDAETTPSLLDSLNHICDKIVLGLLGYFVSCWVPRT